MAATRVSGHVYEFLVSPGNAVFLYLGVSSVLAEHFVMLNICCQIVCVLFL